MTTRNELLELFKRNTGKVLVSPKTEPSVLRLYGYQNARTNRFQLREKA
jgi:hypothetical protein